MTVFCTATRHVSRLTAVLIATVSRGSCAENAEQRYEVAPAICSSNQTAMAIMYCGKDVCPLGIPAALYDHTTHSMYVTSDVDSWNAAHRAIIADEGAHGLDTVGGVTECPGRLEERASAIQRVSRESYGFGSMTGVDRPGSEPHACLITGAEKRP